MHWVVQNNIFNESRYDHVIETLEHGGIPYTVVKVIPFSHELESKPAIKNPIAVIGSYTLVKIAKSYGWGPGVFYNDQIDHRVYAPIFDKEMLNAGAVIMRFGDVHLEEDMFVRPSGDGKNFTGQVFSPSVFNSWRELVRENIGSSFGTVTEDTPVLVAPPVDILAEYRFFVVDKAVITGSQYQWLGRKAESSYIPGLVSDYAYDMVQRWQPDRGYVIDIALTPTGPRVIEFNNLNAAGWYHSDVSKLIQAVEMMDF
jgi:hypothetical protein